MHLFLFFKIDSMTKYKLKVTQDQHNPHYLKFTNQNQIKNFSQRLIATEGQLKWWQTSQGWPMPDIYLLQNFPLDDHLCTFFCHQLIMFYCHWNGTHSNIPGKILSFKTTPESFREHPWLYSDIKNYDTHMVDKISYKS